MGSKVKLGLLVAAGGAIAVGATAFARKKKEVDITVSEIEQAVMAMDPASRAAVMARLSADAVAHAKSQFAN